MFSRADTNENMEVEDDVNKTLTKDKSEDEGEDKLNAGDSRGRLQKQWLSSAVFKVWPCVAK